MTNGFGNEFGTPSEHRRKITIAAMAASAVLVAFAAVWIAVPEVFGSSDAQLQATQQQQTVDALVEQRFQQTADALAVEGPALTEAFEATVNAQFDAALTATAVAQSGPSPINAANAAQIVLRNTLEADSGVQAIAFRPDSTQIATAHADGTTRLWDLAARTSQLTAPSIPTQPWPAAFSADGTQLVTGSPEGAVQVWNATTGESITTIQAHDGPVTALALSSTADVILSASADGTVRLWDAASGQLLNKFEGHTGGATALALSTDGVLLATGDAAGIVRIWSVALDTAANVPAETPLPQTAEAAPPTEAPATVPPQATATPDIFPTPVTADVQIAEQVLENGRMIWIRFNLQIWVMVAAEGDPYSGDWYCFNDTFEEGDAEIDPDLEAPSEDLIQPRRGFGKVWRENPEIQQSIGWAITPEFELTSAYTYLAGGTVENGQYMPGPGEHRLTTLYGDTISFYESEIRGDCQGGTWHLSQ